MISLAEAAPSPPGGSKLRESHRRELNARGFKEGIQFQASFRAAAAFQNDGRFECVGDRHAAVGSGRNQLFVALCVGFTLEDREQGGGVDNQVGRPWSSSSASP